MVRRSGPLKSCFGCLVVVIFLFLFSENVSSKSSRRVSSVSVYGAPRAGLGVWSESCPSACIRISGSGVKSSRSRLGANLCFGRLPERV